MKVYVFGKEDVPEDRKAIETAEKLDRAIDGVSFTFVKPYEDVYYWCLLIKFIVNLCYSLCASAEGFRMRRELPKIMAILGAWFARRLALSAVRWVGHERLTLDKRQLDLRVLSHWGEEADL